MNTMLMIFAILLEKVNFLKMGAGNNVGFEMYSLVYMRHGAHHVFLIRLKLSFQQLMFYRGLPLTCVNFTFVREKICVE